LQQERVQPSAVLVSDRAEPTGVDESSIAVQRKGGRPVGVYDDGDHLTNARSRAALEEGAE